MTSILSAEARKQVTEAFASALTMWKRTDMPRRLDDALTWVENDHLANARIEAALALLASLPEAPAVEDHNLSEERRKAHRMGYLEGLSASTARNLVALLNRGLKQLDQWQKKYGEHQPAWLPPAGDVRWAEDVAEALGEHAPAQPQVQGEVSDARDAARYRWLRDLKCNSFSVGRDENHACNYMTAEQWIEECSPADFSDVPADELQRMKDTNTIWALQVYPNTPVGFNLWQGASLDFVIDAAMKGQP